MVLDWFRSSKTLQARSSMHEDGQFGCELPNYQQRDNIRNETQLQQEEGYHLCQASSGCTLPPEVLQEGATMQLQRSVMFSEGAAFTQHEQMSMRLELEQSRMNACSLRLAETGGSSDIHQPHASERVLGVSDFACDPSGDGRVYPKCVHDYDALHGTRVGEAHTPGPIPPHYLAHSCWR